MMKNRIRKIGLLLLSTLLVTNCTDLEEEPVGLFSPESFFQTPEDVEIALLGSYYLMLSESFYGRKLPTTLMLRSDMCDIGDQGTPARRIQINNFDVDSNNGMTTAFWPQAYEIIGAANAAIGGAEQLDLENPEVKAFVAEARFIRAFIYFHLVRIFGDIPYIDAAIRDPSSVDAIEKTSADEVYQGILADLEYGVANLPNTPVAGAKSRAYKGSALSFLALVHLTLGNWEQAYNNAKEVIDNRGTYATGLTSDYADLFDAQIAPTTIEPIFTIDFKGNEPGLLDFMGPMTGVAEIVPNQDPAVTPNDPGWSVIVPSQAVFDSWNDQDYRKEVSFITEGYNTEGELVGFDQFATGFGVRRPHIAKYFTNCGQSAGSCQYSDRDYVGIRFAEVLLIAAEALNEIGGSEGEILGYVNEIRARARNANGVQNDFPADLQAGLGQAQLRDSILDERRLELAFEFKRWYDIKRRQLGEEVFTGSNSLEPHPNFNGSRDYLLPLPQDELDRNPNLLPQNPGY